ncbi:exocyst complex component sec15 subunit [Vararia minispora EC-137]|uniref:Exocyst complex component sec15 subunit n=1 Tax=Vararia minispora EC-137 TaxID=1314806 RepID=A0ACB8QIJ7_9AGAM|nr:exocyst complex component sec15 subunit [Vararia minispora EC-137]
MPPRRRPQFTQETVEQQLQQIHLLDPSSSSENLEQLGPIIKQIHQTRQQDAYLRTLQSVIDAKDAEIERICGDNYQDFLASVSTLFTVKSYTNNLRDKINTLDASVSQIGRGLVEKKRALLQAKKTASNLDEAIDNMQAGLRVLDVVNRVGEMVKEGKYWSALRSLDEIQYMPSSSLAQTPLYQYILTSLPSLRGQIKDAVTASNKQWLLEIRNLTGRVGRMALDAMDLRSKKWRSRRERDPLLRLAQVGSAVEIVTFEKTGHNVLETEDIHVDFKPLYQSIHIYTALDSLDELRRSYQGDRKAQSDLILPIPLPLGSLSAVVEEFTGFFIIEAYILDTTGSFRSMREIEELWEAIVERLTGAVEAALEKETDPDSYLRSKEQIMAFVITLESYSYSTQALHAFALRLFEKYATLLERQFSKRFKDIIANDDLQPMVVETISERDAVLRVVWLQKGEQEELAQVQPPTSFPWSQGFYLACEDVNSIRSFVQRFYQFIEGVSQHHRNVDELLSKSLETILKEVSFSFLHRLSRTSQPSQVAQMISNIEHFISATSELERSLTALRATQRGGTIRIDAGATFGDALAQARARAVTVITNKLDQFGLSDYDWKPAQPEGMPSSYLTELVAWLTTVVDSLQIREEYKDEVYTGAVAYIADCLMGSLTDRSIPIINENALQNVLTDIGFLEDTFIAMGHEHVNKSFTELRATIALALSETVSQFLIPAARQASYREVKPKRLQAVLEKLAKYGASLRDPVARERADRRRREAEQVGRLFPGESR